MSARMPTSRTLKLYLKAGKKQQLIAMRRAQYQYRKSTKGDASMFIGSAEISARLQSERERTGLTIEQFSVLSGVTVEAYRAFEAGDLVMTHDFVLGLKPLGCDPMYIHCGEREVPLSDPKIPTQISFYGVPYDSNREFQDVVHLRASRDKASFDS